jgi:threonine/homoserine/homoserine lactone efflux protein
MLYVVSRSLAQGWRAGVASSFGIAAGCGVHTLAVAFGLATLLQTVPIVYHGIRIAGAVYLIVLGIRLLTHRVSRQETVAVTPMTTSQLFRQGFLTNLLNPKVAVFFLAFLPQFVDASQPVAIQILMLGILFNISGTFVNIGVALGAGYIGDRLRPGGWFRWIPGGTMIGLGLHLVIKKE